MRRHSRFPSSVLPLAAILAAAVPAVASGTDWPHLRGPALDGSVRSASLPDDVALALSWKRPLGSGYSGVVVAGGRAVTMFSDGDGDWAAAFATDDGKEAWRVRLGDPTKGRDGADDGPLSSPLIDDGLVYALSSAGKLLALRLDDGKQVWSADLPDDLDAERPHFGFTTTPLVAGKLLVVQTGGADGHAVTAFDKKKGKRVWSAGDEKVEYQSPTLLELAGRSQVVAVSGKRVQGLDPADGKLLWEQALGDDDYVESATPTYAGKDRFMIFSAGAAVVYEVRRSGGDFAVEEVFRSPELGGTYAAPVYHDGHLYGFRRQFLSCIDAETGELVWKSRPPGGRGLILLGDDLVIFGAKGVVVVAAATPEGYRERAQLETLEGSGYTWPSYAGGKVFVRNLESLAAVELTSGGGGGGDAQAALAGGAGSGAFAEFVRRVEQAGDDAARAELIDGFMQAHPDLPLIEGDTAHFVYRGEVEDIAIAGTMIASGLPDPLYRVEGTDFYYRSYDLEPGGRWEYQFNVDYDRLVPDPHNARTAPASRGDDPVSVVMGAGYREPDFLEDAAEGRRGRLETFAFESEKRGGEREVTVYLPRGYDDGERRYPLLVVQQGQDWLERGALANTLDNLIGERVAPLVVAFIEPSGDWWVEGGGSATDPYVDMLADELVPRLAEKYRLEEAPSSRALLGRTYFGATAAYAALKHPDVFGKAALYSPSMGLGVHDALVELLRSGAGRDVKLYVDWNRYDYRNVDSDIDFKRESRELVAALEAGGYEYSGGEQLDSFGWGGWRARADDVLVEFFPLD
jgi:enterochelin esterase-like enzyme/outer membrane protein assembly factor BamB